MSSSLLKKLIVLAVLLVGVWGFFILRQVPTSKSPFTHTLDAATGLQMECEGQAVQLVKEKEAWHVRLADGSLAPTDENQLKGLFASLKSIALEDVISSRPDQAANYEVDAASGTRVTLTEAGGKTLVSGVFGKQAPDYRHIFYRPSDSSEVYLALGIYRGELGVADPLAWRDRQLIDIPETQMTDIRIARGSRESHYVRVSTDSWTLNGKPVPSESVNRLVGTLAHLKADSFLTASDLASVNYEGLTYATLTMVGETATVQIRVGPRDRKSPRYPMSSGTANGIVWLSQATTDSLLNFK